jgi:hypothetical protein
MNYYKNYYGKINKNKYNDIKDYYNDNEAEGNLLSI